MFRYITILLSVWLISCEQRNNTKKDIDIQSIEYFEGYKEIVNDANGNLQKGNYLNGFKDGIWYYEVDSISWTKDWGVFIDSNIVFNIPLDWMIIENSHAKLNFKGEVGRHDTAQVALLVKSVRDSFSIHDYRKNYLSDLELNYEILTEDEECFVNNGNTYFISKYHILFKEQDYFIFSLIYKMGNEILDLSYYFKSEKYNNHYYMFFDFLNGVKYKGEFITDHSYNSFHPLDFNYCK